MLGECEDGKFSDREGERDDRYAPLGELYQLELGFDGETQAEYVDFQPELPLRFYW
jgi:hypothetical protein